MNKNYISAEQFLSQSEKVKKTLLNWWQPKIGDWATFKGIDLHWEGCDKINDYCFVESYNKEREDSQWDDDYGITLYNIFNIGNDYGKYGHSFKSKFEVIPLFTETQLRHFVEQKICNGKLTTEYYVDGYKIFILDPNYDEKSLNDFDTNQVDLLEAYWDVVCKIAEESEVKQL